MKFIKRNLDRLFLGIMLLILFTLLIIYIFNTLKGERKIDGSKKIDEISDYNYFLHENDTGLYKTYFYELGDLLKENDINYEEYAKLLSRLFVIDFYTLNNKVTNMDIGGIQFLHTNIKDNFILKASDTLYKNIKSNIYGDRNQELPVVSKADIKNIENITFNHNDIKDDKAFKVKISIEYEKDLGYPKEVNLVIIHDNNKLVIIEVN